MKVGDFWEAVEVFRKATGGSVTSGGRTPKRNKAVGGHVDSYHLDGLAADVVYDTPPESNRIRLAARNGLRLVIESDHDHLQPL